MRNICRPSGRSAIKKRTRVGTRRCSVIITSNESERGRVKENERKRTGERKLEGEGRKEKRTRHQRGIAVRRHLDDSWSNVRVHAAGEGCTSQLQRAIFRSGGHAITRVEDSSSRKSGTMLGLYNKNRNAQTGLRPREWAPLYVRN